MAHVRGYKGARLARWWPRVVAHVIDSWAIPALILVIGTWNLVARSDNWMYIGGSLYLTITLLLAWPVITVFNKFIMQGRTGCTVGKHVMRMRLVDTFTGRPPGVGKAVARWLVHRLDSVLLIGWFFPLWDRKCQTFADKLCETVVVVDLHDLPPERTSWRKRRPAQSPPREAQSATPTPADAAPVVEVVDLAVVDSLSRYIDM